MKALQTRRITRSLTLSNGRGNSLPIPIEVIITIFSRLPLKSIAICRCVSKLWASILRRSDFTDLFLSISCSSSPKLLFSYQRDDELFFFSSPQPQNPDENSSPVVSNYQMKFSYNGYSRNSDLVHGLMCLKDILIAKNGRMKFLLKIFNPSTGEVLILPKAKSNRNEVFSFLGYDPIGEQFKILSMGRPEYDRVCDKYQVLTIGTHNMSWRMIECGIPHHSPRKKICINGVLYYTSAGSDTKTRLVVCFDVRFEKFSFIKTNGILNEALRGVIATPINYNGKLGLLLYGDDTREDIFFHRRSKQFNLWVLEDLEKQEWSHHTFVFPSVPENIVSKTILSFVGVTKENEIVLSSSNPFYLFYLNLEKKSVVRIEIQRTDESTHGVDHVFLDHVEDVKLYGIV